MQIKKKLRATLDSTCAIIKIKSAARWGLLSVIKLKNDSCRRE